MIDNPISPLRQRMIDGMTARRFKEKVQRQKQRRVDGRKSFRRRAFGRRLRLGDPPVARTLDFRLRHDHAFARWAPPRDFLGARMRRLVGLLVLSVAKAFGYGGNEQPRQDPEGAASPAHYPAPAAVIASIPPSTATRRQAAAAAQPSARGEKRPASAAPRSSRLKKLGIRAGSASILAKSASMARGEGAGMASLSASASSRSARAAATLRTSSGFFAKAASTGSRSRRSIAPRTSRPAARRR